MATNELTLQTNGGQTATINNKLLGALAILGAPMLLIEGILKYAVPGVYSSLATLGTTLEFTYIFGWVCAAIGIRQSRITGVGKGAMILFYIQITGLILALLLNTQDLLQIKPEQSGVFYTISDLGYPLSHLLMTVVGIFIVKAEVWCGVRRIAPFLIGLALPTFLVISPIVGFERAFFVFPVLTTIGFLIIGYSLFRHKAVE